MMQSCQYIKSLPFSLTYYYVHGVTENGAIAESHEQLVSSLSLPLITYFLVRHTSDQ